MSDTKLKILHSEMTTRLSWVLHFIEMGFKDLQEAGAIQLTYVPNSEYHENFIDHTITMEIKMRTEYPSEGAMNIMQQALNSGIVACTPEDGDGR